jgi:hypothetical protein
LSEQPTQPALQRFQPEDVDTHVMTRQPSFDADDTVKTANATEVPISFDDLEATLTRPKRRSELDVLISAKDRKRSLVSTLPGLQDSVAPKHERTAPEEREDAGGTRPFDRKLLAGHAAVFDKAPTVIVSPSVEVAAVETDVPDADRTERTEPLSLAPVAVDIDAEQAAKPRPHVRTPATTVRVRRPDLAKPRSLLKVVAASVALTGAVLVALFAFRHTSQVAAPSLAAAPEAAKALELPLPPAMDLPAPQLVPVTGTITVRGTRSTILVDGERKPVQDGRVVVTCGKHRLGAGRRAQTVMVPCGGTVAR